MEKKSIRILKGIGEKTEKLFWKLNIFTTDDLLRNYPRTYDVYMDPVPIDELQTDTISAVKGMIVKSLNVTRIRNLEIITGNIRSGNNNLALTWFNMPFLQKTIRPGSQYIFRGRLVNKNGRITMEQAEIFTLGDYEKVVSIMQPIYGLTAGLSNKMVVKIVKQLLDEDILYEDCLPEYIKEKYQLIEYNLALNTIHFPKNKDEFILARKRLVFEEFFIFILALRKLKEHNIASQNYFNIKPSILVDNIIERLPYNLTNAQIKVWGEIKSDLSGEKTMNRLIQGDVGSGKTILAFLALLLVTESGYQGALMVPTGVLAKQHYDSLLSLFEDQGINKKAILLTGSMTAKEKRVAYEKIAGHEVDIIIGTHALIQEKVLYSNLALVITDEQHRFGVRQREALADKGITPDVHVLVMSATPIPRTLAIIIYGDLDISVIDELPANRLPIKNCVVNKNYRPKAYTFIEKEVAKGRQAYVICPMVEESEMVEAENVLDYTNVLKEKLPSSINVKYLHGKMKAKEKEDIMEAFAANEIQVLVSTTVVEVGVNVPNATVMMIENAERFGLAGLHQLRGRVGRGKDQSYCILVSGNDGKDTKKRLEILNHSNDGFFIASEDLKLRGPGDLFGFRQSGLMEFKIGDVYTDHKLLELASECAGEILLEDKELEKEDHLPLKKHLEHIDTWMKTQL
ncbi:MAG: ATP-dependent DNA helicase RecG [Clostridiales bacterium]|nr:ATP-dependent DNA helicase RecG [Clostridiales bacterium]